MNIFNRAYFSEEQLAAGAAAMFDSLEPGGIWIVGRTLEDDLTNHATFFRRQKPAGTVGTFWSASVGMEVGALAQPARIDDGASAAESGPSLSPTPFLLLSAIATHRLSEALRSRRSGWPLP